MLSSPASRSVRPFPALSPPLPRLPILSNPALLRPPLPRDCRLPSSLLFSGLRFPDASDALSPYPPCAIRYRLCELSHRRVLALGLTERLYFLRINLDLDLRAEPERRLQKCLCIDGKGVFMHAEDVDPSRNAPFRT